MIIKIRTNLVWSLIFLTASALMGCQPAVIPVQEQIVETVIVTEVVEGETVEIVVTSTPAPASEPAPSGPRTLSVCMAGEPDSLYLHGSHTTRSSAVLEAIYDGPIDNRSYGYQAVILEKIPDLANGDAVLETVTASAGDRVVDNQGNPVILEAGMRIRPAGCRSGDCAIEFDGTTPLEMDRLRVEFRLLPGLKWSDGEPLTAADSRYSFEIASDPDTLAAKYLIDRTADYVALDTETIEWAGLPGYLDSTYFLNFWSPLPQHAWSSLSAEELYVAEASNRAPLGWGAYAVVEWRPGDQIILQRNEHYFRAGEGLPHFDFLVYRFSLTGDDAMIAQLLSGECDVISAAASLRERGELLLELQADGLVDAQFVIGTAFEHLDFGIVPAEYDDGWQPGDRPDFFGDVRTRRAFALCMDRASAAERGQIGQAAVLDTYIPPQHPLFNPAVESYAFDPGAGSALLEEVGWTLGEDGVRVFTGDHPRIPAGTRLSVRHYHIISVNANAIEAMQTSLAECGIEILSEAWGADIFDDGPEGPLFGRNFDLGHFVWLTGVQPPCDLWLSEQIPGEDLEKFPSGWGGANLTGYSSPEYDAACKAALQSLPGEPGYTENHLLAQEIFARDLPVIPLYLRIKIGATRPDFCNYQIDPTIAVDTWNIEEWDYGPQC
jgi:peptide/nickel transport system substrate-binding protein